MKVLLLIVTMLTGSLILAAVVYASCIPSYETVILWDTGCALDLTIYKKDRDYISFPDGNRTSKDPEGQRTNRY